MLAYEQAHVVGDVGNIVGQEEATHRRGASEKLKKKCYLFIGNKITEPVNQKNRYPKFRAATDNKLSPPLPPSIFSKQ